MRQVPKSRYAIIGNGRLASHFVHYFTALSIPYQQWSRSTDQAASLAQIVTNCDRILVLISDSAIEDFITANPLLKGKILIHCSGALTTPLAHSAHPLMTFTPDLYNLEKYQKIPFVLEEEGSAFHELFPDLDNPHYYIPASQKSLYHSLCVLSANFTCILWQKFFSDLEQKLKLPKEIAFPYLQQVLNNINNNPVNCLTGPLARGDQKTIAANIEALEGDPYQQVYQAFVAAFQRRQS